MSLEFYNRFFIIYRPDGRYGKRVRFPIPSHIQDRAEAQRWHDDFIREWKAARGKEEPRALTGLTIGQLWPSYLEWSKMHHAATTHRDIEKNVGQWVIKYLGQYDAEGIGPHHVGIYQRMRAGGDHHPSNRTINKELAYLGGMIKWAGRQGHITPRRVSMDRLPYKRPLPQVLSAPEVLAVINAAEPFYRAYLLSLFVMGLRSIEARNLRWKDIDWRRGTANMIQKGGTMKSLPMGPALMSSLRTIAPPESNRKAGWGDLPVFLNPDTGKAVFDIRKAIRRACKKAGIEKRVTPHMLRHSCATAMVDKGINLRVIQSFLGHSNVTTTEIYTHVSLENLRDAQKLISRGLRNKIGRRKGAQIIRLDTARK
ncbi:MAG: tyrosine-type recombinase/integrase [Dehalococcoidia bacterium]|jgi:integrase